MEDTVADLNRELIVRNDEVYDLREENASLKDQLAKTRFSFNAIKDSDAHINFFTGLASAGFILWIIAVIKGRVKTVEKSLSVADHLLLVLMKLKLGLLNKDLAYRFDTSESTVSRIYRVWLPAMSECLAHLIVWPTRAALRANLPTAFRRKFRDCVAIIDCTEIFTERPSNLTAQAQTWSRYKHNNTIKYLIGITPAGAISFLSKGWSGRESDKNITLKCGFLNKLKPGDCILADRGFLVKDELARIGVTLRVPSYTKGKSQLSACEVDTSRQLSHVRIHVERVIGRIKKFHILQTTIPITQVVMLDHVMIVCSALANLNRSVVRKSTQRNEM